MRVLKYHLGWEHSLLSKVPCCWLSLVTIRFVEGEWRGGRVSVSVEQTNLFSEAFNRENFYL